MSRKMRLDFTGVESFQRASEGEHLCKIVTVDEKQSQGGNNMIVVAFEVIKGEDKSSRVFENYPLVETALWKLKGLLQAIGMKADGKVQLDLDKLVGKTCIVNVTHEEYEGKIRARVESVRKVVVNDSDEDDEDVVDEDVEDEQEEKPAKAEKSGKSKVTGKKTPMPKPVKGEEEDEDDDDWDDEEEEEEKKPAPKKSEKKPDKKADKKAEKPSKKPAKKAEEDDDDDDWDDDDWDE